MTEPNLGAVRAAAVARHDIVSQHLVNNFVKALGFEPSAVAALWIDEHNLTVVSRVTFKHTRLYIDKTA